MQFPCSLVGLQIITLTFQSEVGIGILLRQTAEEGLTYEKKMLTIW